MSEPRIIRRVTIRGRVQGVGFRMWTEEEAAAHGIEGWARNRRDGTVEAVFAGPRNAVDAMIAACRHGPPAARIEAVDVHDADARVLAERRAGETFSLLPTV
jgi:acylphosphatase